MERDKFMSPIEAQKFGLIDKILDHPPKLTPDADAKKSTDSTDASKEELPVV